MAFPLLQHFCQISTCPSNRNLWNVDPGVCSIDYVCVCVYGGHGVTCNKQTYIHIDIDFYLYRLVSQRFLIQIPSARHVFLSCHDAVNVHCSLPAVRKKYSRNASAYKMLSTQVIGYCGGICTYSAPVSHVHLLHGILVTMCVFVTYNMCMWCGVALLFKLLEIETMGIAADGALFHPKHAAQWRKYAG